MRTSRVVRLALIPKPTPAPLADSEYRALFAIGYSAVSDAALAIYPIYLIWGLQVTMRMKIGLCFLLGFGLVAAACSALKTAELTNLQRADEEGDITYFVARLSLTTIIEAWIVLIGGCIPPCRPLLKALLAKIRGTTSSTTRIYTGTHPYQRYDKYGAPYSVSRALSVPGKTGRASLAGQAFTGNRTRVYYDPKGDLEAGFELRDNVGKGAEESDKPPVPPKEPDKAIVMTRITEVDFS